MNRKDLPLVVVLVALLLAWPVIDRTLIRPRFGAAAPPRPVAPLATGDVAAADRPGPALVAPAAPTGVVAVAAAPPPAAADDEPPSAGPARTVILSNAHIVATFTARGAALASLRILEYPQSIGRDSGPVVLDFGAAPTLALEGLGGLGPSHDFAVAVESDRAVRFERTAASGVRLTRTVTLEDGYVFRIRDRFEGLPPAGLASFGARLGPMGNLPGESAVQGVAFLGVDTLSPGGEKVRYWGASIPGFFKERGRDAGGRLPVELEQPLPLKNPALDWAAVKNKYFVQILRPEGGAQGVTLHVRRTVLPRELEDPSYKPRPDAEQVSATVQLPPLPPGEGGGAAVRDWTLYAGPKKHSELSRLAYHQADVMEFGMWAPIGKLLLQAMNGIHRVLPNYGVAIILLTILVRVVFWPITHKGTQSMKRMQEIQPLVNEIRQKYKEPQRQQKEIMALYKQHKVNPLGGCLPMLIQIPVFIALFTVLRSAIELRFAPFLWVRDLSEPERLLSGTLPFSLNLLPLLMTVAQYYQTKLTPSGADPAQQKMMAFMPFIMLIFFYNFASGLVLYWTTNTVLMLGQQLLQMRRTAAKAAAARGGTP